MKQTVVNVSKTCALVIHVNWKMSFKSYFETGSTSLTPQTHSNLDRWDLFDVLQPEHASKYHPNLEVLNCLVVSIVVAKPPYMDNIVNQ